MIYNKRIIQELGKVPETYSEYLEAAEKYYQDTDGDGYVDQWFGYSDPRPLWRELVNMVVCLHWIWALVLL